MEDGRTMRWAGQRHNHENQTHIWNPEFGLDQMFHFDPSLVRIEEEENPPSPIANGNMHIPSLSNASQEAAPNESNPTSIFPSAANPAQKPKLQRRAYVIDSIHLSFLVASYHEHFNKYSNLRKKTADQLIPSIIWKAVYADYCTEFPNNTFQEDSLKVKLRETLRELKTGTSNDDNIKKITLQPVDFLQAIKGTKGHAKQKTLNLRAGIIEQMSPGSHGTHTSFAKDTSATTCSSIPSLGDKEKCKSKGEILAETAQGITTLANSYAREESNRNDLIQVKMESEKKRCRMFSSKDRSMRMNDLIKLRGEGFYTPEHFRKEMQEILDSSS